MARKKEGGQPPKENAPRHEIIQRPMDEVMHISMIPYAEHVILERALPRVEDGLKPGSAAHSVYAQRVGRYAG